MDMRAIHHRIAAGLAARYPHRIVTRSLVPVEDRDDDELAQGVITVITDRATNLGLDAGIDIDAGRAEFFITAQVWAGREAMDQPPDMRGEVVADHEAALFGEIAAFARAPGTGLCPLELTEAEFSGQVMAAGGYGWVVCRAGYQELD